MSTWEDVLCAGLCAWCVCMCTWDGVGMHMAEHPMHVVWCCVLLTVQKAACTCNHLRVMGKNYVPVFIKGS